MTERDVALPLRVTKADEALRRWGFELPYVVIIDAIEAAMAVPADVREVDGEVTDRSKEG